MLRPGIAGAAWLSSLLSMASAGESLPAPSPAAPPMISNGDFEKEDGKGWPADWPRPAEGVTWREEQGNHYLHFETSRPSQFLKIQRTIIPRPGDKAYRLTVRARYRKMHYGPEMWYDGRIILTFKDRDGKEIKPKPSDPHWNKGSKDWDNYSTEFLVPDGAVELLVMPSLIRVASGTLDLDDIAMEPIPAGPLIEKRKLDAARAAEAVAQQIAGVKAKVPPAPADQFPSMLHVDGNQLLNADGKPVWLQGVAIPSLEWCEGGEHIVQSTEIAIRDWKANCIRLPLKAEFWFGKGPYRHDGGAQYKQIVDDAMNLCAANGTYLVIDLHGFNAPDQEAVKFWEEAAERYKNNPAVLFELFNEPFNISWEIWRNGGTVVPPKKYADAPVADQEQPRAFKSVGMQKLVDTVRATGAKNVVIAGGLDWGYDLSGVVKEFTLKEHNGGHGIMYSSHIYPWKKDWQKSTLDAAARYPVFIGEVGTPPDYNGFQFIKPEERHPLEGWAEDVLGLIQKYKLNWTGWSFHSKAGPCLLSGSDYTPTPYWGAYVKEALAGKPFEMKKMR